MSISPLMTTDEHLQEAARLLETSADQYAKTFEVKSIDAGRELLASALVLATQAQAHATIASVLSLTT